MSAISELSQLGSPGLIAKRVARRIRRDREGILEPPVPPVCPTGWEIGPPDFVGIGAQRAGTTRWFDLLSSHPEIVPAPAQKELHYFDQFYVGGFDSREAEHYQRQFPRPPGAKAGEWTPMYLAAPWIPPMMARAAPNARLLVLLRDPVERYRSGLEHNAWVAAKAGLPLSQHAPTDAFMRGLYHQQLQAWLAHFDRSQILVLQFERCAAEPRAMLDQTLDFLGVSTDRFAPDLTAHPHYQPDKPRLDPLMGETYAEAYRADVSALVAEFPGIDLALWPNFASMAR